MPDRVLILDDDDRLAAMLRSYLSGRGVESDHAADVASGLRALERTAYDAARRAFLAPRGNAPTSFVCR